MYPSTHEHFSLRQPAYGDPEHWSLTIHDWFKERLATKY